ncbi:MAG: hypothetical protein GY795_06040 [Desulfobacterales bacterium]|nr:hypothetical protein [Desulfobacterales bacterium]
MRQNSFFHIWIIFMLFSCLLLNGCAVWTRQLWRKHTESPKSATAVAEQIYLSYEKTPLKSGLKLTPKYCIPYRLQQDYKTKGQKITFPERPKGYFVIRNDAYYTAQGKNADSTSLNTEIESIFNSPIDIDIISLNAVKTDKCGLRIAFKLPEKIVEKKESLSENEIQYVNKLNKIQVDRFSSSPFDSKKMQKKSVYYYSLCNNADAEFLKKFDTSKWTAILPQKKSPFNMRFHLMNTKTDYYHSLPIRIICTPLAVATDILTSPIQLIWVIFIINLNIS